MAKRVKENAAGAGDIDTRQRLLDAMIALAETSGVASVTLEAVSAHAGVSKGGLLHYFPNKAALLEAMVEEIVRRYYDRIAARVGQGPEPEDAVARAYVATSANLGPGTKLWTAVLTASLLQPSLLEILRDRSRQLWAEGMKQTDNVDAAVAWLAADGLWLSEMLGLYEVTPELRAAVTARLAELTAQ
ncbi:TetR/AcrR family transcriptional regulator [Planosporangium flavigriseum]|uniref:TetR family transcriptional regulator n=1 Tax=Planosporangium flavigriseum TaxID=373681 RepID=A0A8J3LMH8_9ACTN|nr:TetR family transcriptional regulator [Planosporangium flavigriseum]NJC66572.1 TetR/AcrR family transcriptional regulator [Planosporangium flavigriseum]GIG73445.1 TetR family transcriptional regulator [Planosporangium flavigriseum]